MQELGHETALLSCINHRFGSIAWQCTLPGREILKYGWFCFCFFCCCLEFQRQHGVGVQLIRLWVCWMGLVPGGAFWCSSWCWARDLRLSSHLGMTPSPLLQSIPRVVVFLTIFQNPGASQTALHSPYCSWWRAWHVSLGCLLAGGGLLAFAAVSLHPWLTFAIYTHTSGLSHSHLHVHMEKTSLGSLCLASIGLLLREEAASCPLPRSGS